MIKRTTLLLLLAFNSLQAQDWANYQPFKAQGPVPADFRDVYLDKYLRQKEQISTHAGKRTRRREDDFYRRSEFFVNEFLISGNVVYGDSISEYCEKILDILLDKKPMLRDELRVYTVKSPVLNALATGNGIIFVNTGLMAQVENEAQLAYILAHEVVHYEEKHVLNQYIEIERIRNGEDLYRKTGHDEKLLALSTYSKSQELEADKEGFLRFFQNSGYHLNSAFNVMDVLQYSYLPFDEIEFDPHYLSKENFSLPNDYLLEETAAITGDADYDDSESTHPNIKKRRLAIYEMIQKGDLGEEYLVSEKTFKYCQRLARYENSRLYLNRREYPQAIYNSFLLEQKYGPDRYQKLTVAKALQAASAYRLENDLYKILDDYKDVEGYSQQAYFLMSKLTKPELNTLAVLHAYDLVKRDSSDKAAFNLFEQAMENLVLDCKLTKDDFAIKLKDTSAVFTLDSIVENRLRNRSSKIATIKKMKAEEKHESTAPYKYTFVDYWDDPLFNRVFDKYLEIADRSGYREQRYRKSRVRTESKYDKNTALGIDKMICVTPLYLKLDEREDDGIRYLTTDEKLASYRDHITDLSRKVRLHTELLDYKTLGKEDDLTFNDIAMLKSWISERISHGNTDAPVTDFDYLGDLRERYETDYLAYTGNLSLRVREDNVALQLIGAMILYPYLPFVIADLLTPEYESFNFFFLFDLRNGDALLAEYNYYPTNDKTDYLRSIIYNDLIQIKDKPKTKK